MDRPRIRPLYPVLAPSSPTSLYASSSSLASFPSPSVMSDRASVYPSSPSATSSAPQSAPLPSPAAADQRSFFFASLNNRTLPQTHPHQQPQQHQQHHHHQYLSLPASYPVLPAQPPQSPAAGHFPQHAFQQQQQQQQQHQQQQQLPQQQQAVPQHMYTGHSLPDRKAAGATNPETVAFLRDYNLVAEAAKRAQVACMIRDLDAMDMS